jgi:hypothetical protein
MLSPIYQEILSRVLVLVLHLLVSNSRLDKQEGCKWSNFGTFILTKTTRNVQGKISRSVNVVLLNNNNQSINRPINWSINQMMINK